ncbi:MAG: hypothetical protein AB7I59_13800 [Geminicoccaceae bacterium]
MAAPLGAAWAQSGDFPLNPDNPTEVPTYSIPEATCDTIRQAIDNNFDLVLACSIAGRSSDPDNTPCDLIDGDLNAGTPIGQCLDSFPVPLTTPAPAAAQLEADVNIAASAAGLNLALGDRDRISVTSVAGSAGTLLGLVDVEPGACGGGECPASCGGIPVVQSATACNEVTAQLVTSVLEAPPQLSHALFLDVQATATDGFLKVAVCPNYHWTCADPSAPLSDTNYAGQVPFSVAYTPLCTRTARLTLCCATNALGQPIRPCPR